MIEVTCAVIIKDKKVLICQRSEKMKLPLKWEFPGGKIEPFETKEECIVREIKEELNLDVEILSQMHAVEHYYPDFSIKLHPFLCGLIGGELKTKEHKQVIWVSKDNLNEYDWAEADLPIVRSI